MRLPRRTARLRLTLLYVGACLTFGTILLAVTYLLTWSVLGTTLTAHPQPEGSPASPPAQQSNPSHILNGAEQTITVDRQLLVARSAIALGVVTVAAAGADWLLAGRVLRPLSTITLDGLFARLDASFGAQRRFAANASHELRIPLTRERALLQVTLADPASTTQTWQAVSRELLASNAEQERLIEALLTLASSEASLGEREPLDLADITRAVLAVPRPGIGRLGLNVRTGIQPAALRGDPLLIQRLVTNLIDNAVGHNIAGGDVLIATGMSDGRAVVSVANSGLAIAPAEADRLLQPFQRLGTRSARRGDGHGLGLSIVSAITTAHDAAITVRPRPGGGLAVKVTFPVPTAGGPYGS